MAELPPAPPAGIIHSVPHPSLEHPGSPRAKKQPSFSPAPVSLSSLKRIFSPNADRKSPTAAAATATATSLAPPDVDESDSSTDAAPDAAMGLASAPTSSRKRIISRICACFESPHPVRADDDEDSTDFSHHIRSLEPTYEPEAPLLPPAETHTGDRICLVLDLDETLVHSSFTPISDADFEIPLEMQGETHMVFVKKRPGVDQFLKKVSEWYEVVVFTASLALYANPVMDLLDPTNLVQLRLYREHCVLIGGCYVKDIAKLGRDLKQTFIIDNSPLSYVLQPENAIPITAFFTDDADRELHKTLALLEQAKHLKDVRNAFS